MKHFLFLLTIMSLSYALSAQYVYTIKADSVKLTNCDSSELIIENHTQNVPGFLFNTGNGRTVFKRGMQKISDSIYVIGVDTLTILKGPKSFGLYVQRIGQPGDTVLTGHDSILNIAAQRDSQDFHHIINPDKSWTNYVQAHDTTSGNALYSKYDADSSRKNIYGGFLPLNLSSSKTINQGGYGITYSGGGPVQFDSTKFTQVYMNPLFGSSATQTNGFGTSIMYGDNTTPGPPINDSNYLGRFSSYVGLPTTNYGVPSSLAFAAVGLINININPGHTSINLLETGLNDLRSYGSGTNSYNAITSAYQSASINNYLASYDSVGGANVTRYGSWTAPWNAKTSANGKTIAGAYTSTAGDSLVTHQTGTGVVIGAIGRNATSASMVVYIDQVKVDSFSTSNQCDVSAYCPFYHAYTGLSNTSHTVKVVYSGGSGLFIVDYIGTLVNSPKLPFIMVEIPHMDATGYAGGSATAALIDTANNRLRALQAALVAKGLPVYIAHTNNFYTATFGTDLSSDHTHPNNLGHFRIFQSILNGLSTFASSPLTIVGSNDGHLYVGENGQLQQLAYFPEITLQKVLGNGAFLNAPSYINVNNFPLSIEGASVLDMDSIVTINKAAGMAYITGQLVVKGASGSLSINDRTGASSFQVVGTGPTIYGWFSGNNSRFVEQWDDSLHRNFLAPNYTHGSFSGYGATVDIMGNQNGLAGHAPLRVGAGKLVTTPVSGLVENDSTHLWYTNAAGSRFQLDQQTGSTSPFSDASALVKNSADPTKLAIFSAVNISTATTRTYTLPNVSGTFPTINNANTWTGIQTFSVSPILNAIPTGIGTALMHKSDSTIVQMQLSSGTYTATPTGVTNVSSISAVGTSSYINVGGIIECKVNGNLTATTSNATTVFTILLPISAPNYTGQGSYGSGTWYDLSTGNQVPVRVSINDGSSAQVICAPPSTNSGNYVLIFQYNSN